MASHGGYTLAPTVDEPHSSPEAAGPAKVEVYGGGRSSSKKCLSLPVFLLLAIAVAVMFLAGVLVGFYISEVRLEDEYEAGKTPSKNCVPKSRNEDIETYRLDNVMFHNSLVYSIRGENVTEFVQKYGTDDPVVGSDIEAKFSELIYEEFKKYSFDRLEVDEHDIVMTSANPAQPNRLEIINANTTIKEMVFKNSQKIISDSPSTTPEWKHPHVAFSPKGEVQANLVYGHYGRKTDLSIVQALNVEIKNKIVLMRLGKLTVAEKIKNAEDLGAVGVLLYWEQEDARHELVDSFSSSYVPFASAFMFTHDFQKLYVPSVPCQTISNDQAKTLMSYLNITSNTKTQPGWTVLVANNTRENVSVRLSVFNKKSMKKIKNHIATILGSEETDHYVIVGAPRSALPGQPQDVVVSTSLLLQLAYSIHHMHFHNHWRPYIGIKIVSWGGAEYSNIGLLHYLKTYKPLLEARAVAYFDLSQLAIGSKTIQIQSTPGLGKLLADTIANLPDPKTGDYNIPSASHKEGRELYENSLVNGYSSSSAISVFLQHLGLQLAHVQYQEYTDVNNSVTSMSAVDHVHHNKYHIAAAHVLVKAMLGIVDCKLLPINLLDTAISINTSLHKTSELLMTCSENKTSLSSALILSDDLVKSSREFQNDANSLIQKNKLRAFAMISNVKMFLDRLFIMTNQGISHHFAYPTLQNGSIEIATEFCLLGKITKVWSTTHEWEEQVTTILSRALAFLQLKS
ncbi:transferrin receptor protein 1-like [Physella acuta]|uniref:transferrin receptor protein 1-like n=1 Tax=Physella acuta TaxID=109671 RepID=UPI0027DC3D08|nr:transferrin receptor protein 1-like [Physella acuta]